MQNCKCSPLGFGFDASIASQRVTLCRRLRSRFCSLLLPMRFCLETRSSKSFDFWAGWNLRGAFSVAWNVTVTFPLADMESAIHFSANKNADVEIRVSVRRQKFHHHLVGLPNESNKRPLCTWQPLSQGSLSRRSDLNFEWRVSAAFHSMSCLKASISSSFLLTIACALWSA